MTTYAQHTPILSVRDAALAARNASGELSVSSSALREQALHAMADALHTYRAEILAANARDVDKAKAKDTRENLIDRLLLTPERLRDCALALRELAAQPDPLGEIVDGRTLAGGIHMKQVRVPLGVIGMIYEARPNVTVDAAGIAIKTGNSVLLRGGSMATHSNEVLIEVLRNAIASVGLSADCVQPVDASDRASADEMMTLHGLIDVLIPRGGAGLIASVVEKSKVPVIETGTGNCHVFVHETADLAMARDIVINAKCQRPSVCNAIESLLIDRGIAQKCVEEIFPSLFEHGVELVVDQSLMELLVEWLAHTDIETTGISLASEEDWSTEYLDLKLSVAIVTGVTEAVDHINTYGSKHSEAIITSDYQAARYFTGRVDAAVVYTNASTRFTDGGMFGLGAEIGISTQKLHARGPMGLAALTSTKFICEGQGQIR